jgi:hypothetical protein
LGLPIEGTHEIEATLEIVDHQHRHPEGQLHPSLTFQFQRKLLGQKTRKIVLF